MGRHYFQLLPTLIICHPLKLIYLKTKKVGGTSFEVALSKYCSSECVITPISPEDEIVRNALKFRGPQNYLESDRAGFSNPRSINFEFKGNFGNHSCISAVKANLSGRAFANYKTLAIHRNPADGVISQYFYRMHSTHLDKREPFGDWYQENKDNVFENYRIAPIRGKQACDMILDYEALDEAIQGCALLPTDFAILFRKLRLKGRYRDQESQGVDAFFQQHGLDPTEPYRLLEGRV